MMAFPPASSRRVMLIQQGARRNYIYASQLEAAGLLHSLVCDAAWSGDEKGWAVSTLKRVLPRAAPIIRRRKVEGIAPERIRATFLPNVANFVKWLVDQERAFAALDEVLALHCRRVGTSGLAVIVNYQGNGGSFLDVAKRRGVSIVTDFVITPRNLEIEQQERGRWPGWERGGASQSMLDFYRRRVSHLVRLSDIYLCPSQTVARDLSTIDGFDPARVRLVPYGISGVLLRAARVEPGRVLFAGAAGLRKGIPYLAEAARILKDRAPNIAVAVAGDVSDAIRSRPETSALTFLGKLGREAMADEMARADVYCLPSLAEGSATSIFEALANGLPVVTTSSSGSVVEDGIEGFIVPERDGPAIAGAIERIVGDRELRHRMSQAARATAEHFNDEACGERFIAVVREVIDARDAARRRNAKPERA